MELSIMRVLKENLVSSINLLLTCILLIMIFKTYEEAKDAKLRAGEALLFALEASDYARMCQ